MPLPSPAREATAVAALLLSAGLVGGCFAPAPEPEDWLAFGFRTPEQTFRSFQTALAGDRPDLEYLCLSADLKRREGIGALAYLEYRDRLLDEEPWLPLVARAEIVAVERTGGDRARIAAVVDWLFWEAAFEVELVAEGYFEYWIDGDRVEDAAHPFEPTVAVPGAGAARALVVALPPPEEADPRELTEVRAGREWKIDGFAELAAPPSRPPTEPTPVHAP